MAEEMEATGWKLQGGSYRVEVSGHSFQAGSKGVSPTKICSGASPTRMKCDFGDELSYKRGFGGGIPLHPLERFAEEPVQQE